MGHLLSCLTFGEGPKLDKQWAKHNHISIQRALHMKQVVVVAGHISKLTLLIHQTSCCDEQRGHKMQIEKQATSKFCPADGWL